MKKKKDSSYSTEKYREIRFTSKEWFLTTVVEICQKFLDFEKGKWKIKELDVKTFKSPKKFKE